MTVPRGWYQLNIMAVPLIKFNFRHVVVSWLSMVPLASGFTLNGIQPTQELEIYLWFSSSNPVSRQTPRSRCCS